MYSSYQEQLKQYRKGKETQNQKKQLEQLQSMEFEHEMPYFISEDEFKIHIIDNPNPDICFKNLVEAIENFEEKLGENKSHPLILIVSQRLEYAKHRCIYYIQNISADNLSLRWEYYQNIIGAIQTVERILDNLKWRKKTSQSSQNTSNHNNEDDFIDQQQLEEFLSIQLTHNIVYCNTQQEFTEKVFNKGPDSLTPFMNLEASIKNFEGQLNKHRVLFDDNTFRILQFTLNSITNNVFSYLNEIQGINNPALHWEVYKKIVEGIRGIEDILRKVKINKKHTLELNTRKSNNNSGIKEGKQEVEESEAMENSEDDEVVITIDSLSDSLVPTETTPLVVHAESDPNENIVWLPVITDFFNGLYKKLMAPTVPSNQKNSQVSYLDILSDEILLKVLKFLPFEDLLIISQSCKRFERLCKDNSLEFNKHIFEKLLQNMVRIFNVGKHFLSSEEFKIVEKKCKNYYPQLRQILGNITPRINENGDYSILRQFAKLLEQFTDGNMLNEKNNFKKFFILSNNYLFYKKQLNKYNLEINNIHLQITANKFEMNCCGISGVIASALSILLTVTLILSDIGKRSPLNDPVIYTFAAIALLAILLTVGYVVTKKLQESIKNYPHNNRLVFFNNKYEQVEKELEKIKPYFFNFKVENAVDVDTTISFSN